MRAHTFPESALVREIMKRATPAFARAAEATLKAELQGSRSKRSAEYRQTGAEMYNALVATRVIGVSGAIQGARDALRLMALVPSRSALKEAELTRASWIDYHFGAFTVFLASVPDVCLVLTGAVLMLDLTEPQCTFDRVVKNPKVKGTPLAAAIKSLRKTASPVVARRHLHVHRGEHATLADMTKESFITRLRGLSFIASFSGSEKDDAFLRKAWRVALSAALPLLQNQLNDVEAGATTIADILVGGFQTRSDAIARLDDAASAL